MGAYFSAATSQMVIVLRYLFFDCFLSLDSEQEYYRMTSAIGTIWAIRQIAPPSQRGLREPWKVCESLCSYHQHRGRNAALTRLLPFRGEDERNSWMSFSWLAMGSIGVDVTLFTFRKENKILGSNNYYSQNASTSDKKYIINIVTTINFLRETASTCSLQNIKISVGRKWSVEPWFWVIEIESAYSRHRATRPLKWGFGGLFGPL